MSNALALTDAEIVAKQTLDDDDRSAFGLGYEYRRRGIPICSNPFPVGSLKAQLFIDGWWAKDKVGVRK